MDENRNLSKETSTIFNEQILNLWKRMERLEERVEDALDSLDKKVQALELAHQLQTYQNNQTKEKIEELSSNLNELLASIKKEREEDRKEQKTILDTIMERLDHLQYKGKAEVYDKIKWLLIGAVVAAIFGLVWSSIVNV